VIEVRFEGEDSGEITLIHDQRWLILASPVHFQLVIWLSKISCGNDLPLFGIISPDGDS